MPMTLAEARSMTIAILDEHYAYNWTVKADRAIVRKGLTHFTKRQISYSKLLLDKAPRDSIVNTILHECAHAIVGPHSRDHGIAWQNTFIALGGDGKVKTTGIDEAYLYIAYCPACKDIVGGFTRKPKGYFRHKDCLTIVTLTKTR